ncbi:glyoxalase [Oceanobacillus arenosus]|uniref:Glyoxalase n=1 Tax=Oceanobacillus arenosus TaxID=1229153 RepID=A0A3D8PIB7_9BACI|nr:VOC family protein [Oceanobacillus arenosus]RDW15843.1 glyoxalase [Oceanobacillus arenosus]
MNVTEEQEFNPSYSVGEVEFKVIDLDRQVKFYEEVVGLCVVKREEDKVYLAGENDTKPLLILNKTASEYQEPLTTGIFHIAFLLPSRKALATKFFHILRSKKDVDSPREQASRYTHFENILPIARLDSASDHGYSEAFYLYDIEGNGIEIYADREREDWDKYPGGSHPLNLKELAELADFQADGKLPSGTTVGHVHLRIRTVKETLDFYTTLGFEPQEIMDTALFVSTDGYHHHIAGNVWNGLNNPHPPQDATGLSYFTLELKDFEDLERIEAILRQNEISFVRMDKGSIQLKDPSENPIIIRAK